MKSMTEKVILTGPDGNNVPLVTATVEVPGGAWIVPPPSDPPLLHEPRASKSVAQDTNLLSDSFDIFIGYE